MVGTWRLSKGGVTPTRVWLTFKRWISGKPLTSAGLAVKDGLANSSPAGLTRTATPSKRWILGCRRLKLLLQSALTFQHWQLSTRIACILILPIQIMAMLACKH